MVALVLSVVGLAGCAAPEATGCRIAERTRLPITFDGWLPTVPVTINGHSVAMGIDTGSQRSLVTPEAAAALGLPADPNHTTRAIGTGGITRTENVSIEHFELGRVDYGPLSLAALSFKAPAGSRDTPVPAGLLGADILSHADVELDFLGRSMALIDVQGCTVVRPPWHGRYEGVRAEVATSRLLTIKAVLNGQALRGLFDSGSSREHVSRTAVERLGITPEMLAADPQGVGSGIGSLPVHELLHRFDTLDLGDERVVRPQLVVSDFTNTVADMLIGEDFMRARRFWLSYATGEIYIQHAPH